VLVLTTASNVVLMLILSPSWLQYGRRFQYLTFTSQDIAYVVQQICLYMHDPREPHLMTLKRIMRYIHGTLDLGLHLYKISLGDLVVYSNAD
jgi:hypothetical protein